MSSTVSGSQTQLHHLSSSNVLCSSHWSWNHPTMSQWIFISSQILCIKQTTLKLKKKFGNHNCMVRLRLIFRPLYLKPFICTAKELYSESNHCTNNCKAAETKLPIIPNVVFFTAWRMTATLINLRLNSHHLRSLCCKICHSRNNKNYLHQWRAEMKRMSCASTWGWHCPMIWASSPCQPDLAVLVWPPYPFDLDSWVWRHD